MTQWLQRVRPFGWYQQTQKWYFSMPTSRLCVDFSNLEVVESQSQNFIFFVNVAQKPRRDVYCAGVKSNRSVADPCKHRCISMRELQVTSVLVGIRNTSVFFFGNSKIWNKKNTKNSKYSSEDSVRNQKKPDHITPVLKELHWLPVEQRITYKFCVWLICV